MRVAWCRIARRVLVVVLLAMALLLYTQRGWRTDSVPQREGKEMEIRLPPITPAGQKELPGPTNRTVSPTVVAPEKAVVAPEKAVVAPEKTVVAPEKAVVAPEKAAGAPEKAAGAPEKTVVTPNGPEKTVPPESDKGLVSLRNGTLEYSFRRNDRFIPSKCSSSLQKKLWTTPWTSGIFHPEVTQLLTPANLHRADYRRLLQYWMPFGFKAHENITYKELVSFVKLVPKTDSIFEFSRSKPRPRCLTCAVVGNGGILNGSRMGEEIDGHHMVFRVNRCIRRGYEEDVGNRTTHLVLMDRSLMRLQKQDIPRDKGMKYVFLACRKNDYRYLNVATTSKSAKTQLRIDGSDARIIHPDFVRYVHKAWENTTSFRPTTGGMMLFLALHAGCDRLSVYGMGFTRQFTEHYYDKDFVSFKAVKRSHDFKREVNILDQLDKSGIIDWYRRGPEPQVPAAKP